MTSIAGPVRFALLLRGYAEAYERLVAAMREPDDVPAFAPLAETLNWAVTIDEAAGAHWAPEGQPLKRGWRERIRGAEVMGGVRFARNRVHHQWAEAVVLDEGGRRYPKRYDVRYHEFLWRPSTELPPGRPDPAGLAVYDELLAGEPADVTLHTLGEAFDDVWSFLELPGRLGMPGTGFSPVSFR